MLTRIHPPPDCLDYLRCNAFIDTLVKARALKTAIDLGLIKYVVPRESVSLAALSGAIGCDLRGTQLLVDLLVGSGVLTYRYADITLSEQFSSVLPYFDLICTKLSLSGYLLTDFSDHFNALIASPDDFRDKASIFSLFEYVADSHVDVSNYRRTRLWVQLTSVLSHYEAAPFLSCYPLDGSQSILDVGGNSGAFSA